MAHHDQLLTADPDAFLAHLDSVVLAGSVTAHREHALDHQVGDARMLVRVYERYSAIGGNRVSMCVSVLAVGTELAISVVTAGGSRAMFFKMNTFGEESFLAIAVQAIRAFANKPQQNYMDEDGR